MIILCIQMNMLLSNKCKVKLQCGKTKLVIHKYSFPTKDTLLLIGKVVLCGSLWIMRQGCKEPLVTFTVR